MTKVEKILSVSGIVLLFTIYVFVIVSNLASSDEYFIGRDTYEAFGDGRFQALDPGDEMYIQDLEKTTFQIPNVERYIFMDSFLFINGYYAIGYGQTADDKRVINSYYPNDELHVYSSLDEVPYYTVINVDTGETEFFLKDETLPEEYLSAFNEPLNWWCEFNRNCFEKSN